MRSRFLEVAAAAAVFLYIAALVFYRLDAFPGLHGDEAWVGLFASRIRTLGVFTPHEMNAYTGPFYAWFISKWFGFLGEGVFALRITGALLNLAALLILLVHLGKRAGRESAGVLLYLAASSAMFLYTSRIAWEVCAVQTFCLAVILSSAYGMIEDRRFSRAAVFAFFTANYFGVWNHFVFLSVPFSLFVASLLYLALYRDWDQLKFFLLTLANCAMTGLVYIAKPPMTEAFWTAHQTLLLAATASVPFVFAASFDIFSRRASRLARRFLEASGAPGPSKALKRLFLLALLAFFIYHAAPLIQIWSNVSVFLRVASWQPPALVSAGLYAWAAALLAPCFYFAYRHAAPKRMSRLGPYGRFLVYWPVVYASIFIAFRHTSSIRHYIILSFLFMTSAAYVLPRIKRLRRMPVVAAGLLVALVLNVCYWSELTDPGVRRPIHFRIGWRMEKSADFLKKDSVYEVLVRENICHLDQDESMIDIPIFFYRREHPYSCENTRSIGVRYCWECEEPPFFSWSIRPLP